MLAFLEFRTLLFSAAMVAGTFAGVMFGTMRTRKTYPGYGRWAWAEVAFAALNLLQACRGQINILFTLVGGNIAAACAMVLLAEGFRQFWGRPYRKNGVYAVSVAFVCGTLYFHFIYESLGIRTLLFCSYVAGMSVYAALPMLMRAPEGRRFGNWFTVTVLLLGSLMDIFHLLAAPMKTTTIFWRTPSNAAFFLTDLMYMIGISFSFFLLTNERYTAELRDSNTESQRLAAELRQKVEELQLAMQQVHTLEKLLPICAWCKRLRTQDSRWITLEQFHQAYGSLTHGICPDCKRMLE